MSLFVISDVESTHRANLSADPLYLPREPAYLQRALAAIAIVAVTAQPIWLLFLVVRTPSFWPWKCPITPPGPAMVLMAKFKQNKAKQNCGCAQTFCLPNW